LARASSLLRVRGPLDARAFTRDDVERLRDALDRKIERAELSWKKAANVWTLLTSMCDDMVNAKKRELRVRKDNPCRAIRRGCSRETTRMHFSPSQVIESSSPHHEGCRSVPRNDVSGPNVFTPAFLNLRPLFGWNAWNLAASLALAGCAFGAAGDARNTEDAGGGVETGTAAESGSAPAADAPPDAVSPMDAGAPDDATGGGPPVDVGVQPDAGIDSDAGRGADAGDGSIMDASDASDAGRDASACKGDLSNVGTGDFHVSATITTVQSGLVALANQRGVCYFGVFWDIRIQNGLLFVETDDNTNYTKLVSTGKTVNDGQPHDLLVKRTAGTLTAYVDGVASGSLPAASSLASLPPLVSRTDPCIGHAGDPTVAFVGMIANLCVAAP
jgi:Laminin G domain